MAGISSKALNNLPENKYKYNGIEKEDAFEIGIYDAQLRELDGQMGRWWQIDPKTENMEMWSPYASNYDNPITFMDPLGDEPDGCCKWLRDAANWVGDKINDIGNSAPVVWVNNNLNPVTPLAELITGKSLNSGFTESKSRSESGVQLATFLVPTAKAETIIANEVKNVVVNQIEKQVVKKAENSLSRKGALNEIKKDVGIPKSQHPDKLANGKQFEKVPMTDRNGKTALGADGKPVMTREYTYTKPDGTKVKVQDHSAGHPQFGKDNPGKHLNVRPPENTRTGTVPGTKKHYPFN